MPYLQLYSPTSAYYHHPYITHQTIAHIRFASIINITRRDRCDAVWCAIVCLPPSLHIKCCNRHTFALWQQAVTSKFGTLSLVAVALQRIRHFIAFQCKLADTARQTQHGTTKVFMRVHDMRSALM